MDAENQIGVKRTEELDAVAKLCLLDDDLMTLVFDRNIEATELLLNVILQRNDLKVLEVVAQREYKNPMTGGGSIAVDYCDQKNYSDIMKYQSGSVNNSALSGLILPFYRNFLCKSIYFFDHFLSICIFFEDISDLYLKGNKEENRPPYITDKFTDRDLCPIF